MRYLDFGKHRQDRRSHTQQHVDADESFVLGTAVGVCVVHVKHHHTHQRESVVQRRGTEER